MSDLQNQLNLLNNYVRTLERENQSKTNEIRTLTSQNNQLISQCEVLRAKSRQSTTIVHSSSSSNLTNNNNTTLQTTIQRLESELKQSKAAYVLLQQQSAQGNQTQRLRQNVHRLEQQKYILQQYKSKLQRQLREIGFKNIDSYVGKMRQLQKSISETSGKIKIYETKMVEYERKITLLTNQVTIKSSQIERLNDKVKSLTETGSYNKINDTRIDQYQKKITQLSSQLTINRAEIDRLKEKQSQYIVFQRENESLKRQIQTLNVRINSSVTSTTQISSLQVTINTLQSQQRQWQRQKQQLLIKISDLQTQVVQKSNTIAQLRLRQDFLKTKQSQQSTNIKQIQNLNNIIRALKIQIQDYKRTISYRQSTIKSLQAKISTSEYSKSSQISSIQRIVDEKNSEINRIIQSHNLKVQQLTMELERYKSLSIVNNQSASEITSLREENMFLKKQSQNNQLLIQQLQREKQNLKMRIRELDQLLIKARSNLHVSQVKTYTTTNDSGQNELTKIVRQLRSQLQQVKKSNAVIHEQNYHMQKYLSQLSESQMQIPHFGNQASIIRYHSPQNMTSIHQQYNSPSQLRLNLQNQQSSIMLQKSKHYHQQPYFKSQMNIQKKRQQRNDRSVMSPVRDVGRSPNSVSGVNMNKQKWDNLQRKISALRVENDQLKRTLLYD